MLLPASAGFFMLGIKFYRRLRESRKYECDPALNSGAAPGFAHCNRADRRPVGSATQPAQPGGGNTLLRYRATPTGAACPYQSTGCDTARAFATKALSAVATSAVFDPLRQESAASYAPVDDLPVRLAPLRPQQP